MPSRSATGCSSTGDTPPRAASPMRSPPTLTPPPFGSSDRLPWSEGALSRPRLPHRTRIPFCLALAMAALAGFAMLPGCGGKGKPWDGVGPKELQAIEQHRNLGIALLEAGGAKQSGEYYGRERLTSVGVRLRNSSFEMAADQFRAITRSAPNLAFGYADLAVADLAVTDVAPKPTDEALQAAREAEKRAPGDPRVQMILAEALTRSGDRD